jgi:hypothetical protein
MTDGDWDAEEYRKQRAESSGEHESSGGWCSPQLTVLVAAVVLVARMTIRLVRR